MGWVFCRSATAYTEHQICTQNAWIISGDVVDVPFGVIDPTNNGTPIRDHQTPKKFSIQKFVFYGQSDAEKFADFNGTIIFEIRQKLRKYSLKKTYLSAFTDSAMYFGM